MNSKKKKITLTIIAIILIVSAITGVLSFKWYDIDPTWNYVYADDEMLKENVKVLYDEYSTCVDYKSERIMAQYVIGIASGAMNFKLIDNDTKEVLFESKYEGKGNYSGLVDIEGHKNLCFVYEILEEETVYASESGIVSVKQKGYKVLDEILGKL